MRFPSSSIFFCTIYFVFFVAMLPSSSSSSSSSSSFFSTGKLGFYDYMTQESSPITFNGALLMMESIIEGDPQWAGNWDPTFSNCSCYYRVRDQYSGTILVNITETCNHAFGVATVTTNDEGLDTLYIYGTPWIRMTKPIFSDSSVNVIRKKGITWSGLCSDPTTCSIDAFVSNDPLLQNWTSYLQVIIPNQTVFNPTITRIAAALTNDHHRNSSSNTYKDLPIFQWIMSTEGVGGPRFYINLDVDPTNSSAWQLLDPKVYNVDNFGNGEIGSCPSLRFDPVTGYFYYLTGGNNIFVIRSRSLLVGSWELGNNNGIILQPDQMDCLVMGKPFGGFYVPNSNATQDIANCQSNPKGFGDDSDVDLTEIIIPNTEPPQIGTLFQYGSGNQKTFGFSNLALYPGSMFEVLDSFFS